MASKLLEKETRNDIKDLFNQDNYVSKQFHEPILDKFSVEVVKLVCDCLYIDSSQFIISVDIIEEYLRMKVFLYYDITMCLSIVAGSILLSLNYVTTHHNIKVSTVQNAIALITGRKLDSTVIRQSEIDILLNTNIPAATMTSDVIMLLDYYASAWKFKTDIKPLCFEILNIVYISKRKLLKTLKNIYKASEDATAAFRILLTKRLYFPASVILSAIKLTKYNELINYDQFLQDISTFTQIHHDHLNFVCGMIYQTITDEF